jgi:hypothetical protein
MHTSKQTTKSSQQHLSMQVAAAFYDKGPDVRHFLGKVGERKANGAVALAQEITPQFFTIQHLLSLSIGSD